MTLRHLPALRLALRRLYPGKPGAYTRFTVCRTAEVSAAGAPSWSSVLCSVQLMHADRVGPWEIGEIRRALKLDLPEETSSTPAATAPAEARS